MFLVNFINKGLGTFLLTRQSQSQLSLEKLSGNWNKVCLHIEILIKYSCNGVISESNQIYLDLSQNISHDWFTVTVMQRYNLWCFPLLSKSSVTNSQIGARSLNYWRKNWPVTRGWELEVLLVVIRVTELYFTYPLSSSPSVGGKFEQLCWILLF